MPPGASLLSKHTALNRDPMNATLQIRQKDTNKSIFIACLYGICKIKQHMFERERFHKNKARSKKRKHTFCGIAVSHFNHCIYNCSKFLWGKHICEHKNWLSQKVILIILGRGRKQLSDDIGCSFEWTFVWFVFAIAIFIQT